MYAIFQVFNNAKNNIQAYYFFKTYILKTTEKDL